MVDPLPNRPNFIFCMCDELRWCELACYGHPHVRTPHIDRLASRGVRFEVGVSNSPVCMPARSLVVSGQHTRTACGSLDNRAWKTEEGGWVMPQWPSPGRPHLRQQTVPERLREAGYTTAAIGKWHIESWPHEVGFDHYVIPAHQHANTAQWFCEDGGPLFTAPGYSVDYEADRVARYLDQRHDDGQPFYLYYNISPPHMPLADAPDRYTGMYGRDDVVIRNNVDITTPLPQQTHQFLTYLWDYRYYRDRLPYASSLPRERFDLIDLTAMYMGLTSWVDDTVGRLLDSIESRGMTDNTVVVFTSDHGDNLGSHGFMGKARLLEESYRIPMIVVGPGVSRGLVSKQVASLADWAPTFATIAGIDTPQHWNGRDLSPFLRGEIGDIERNAAFIETGSHGCAVRTATHLLGIPWTNNSLRTLGDRPHVFHDLVADPYQLDNSVGASIDATLQADLEHMVRTWDAETPWRELSTFIPPGS